jgi:hypothetical protein
MESSWIYGLWLLAGAVCGLALFRLALGCGPRFERTVLALALLGVALAYPVLAAIAESLDWLVPEGTVTAVLAMLAVLGWWRSPLWLAVGWALHAAWSSPVHLVSSASLFVPEAFVLACVGFDVVLVVAIYLRYRRYDREATANA